MTMILRRLISQGPGKPDAEVKFAPFNCLIRGPSDTGKSYIRDCLWYMLGGEKHPKRVPEDSGYETLVLEFLTHDEEYRVTRGLSGGGTAIAKRTIDSTEKHEPVDEDIGELIVRLADAGGKQILRSQSKKGAVTGGDLRHWFLLSQPTVISESPTSGANYVDKTQRVAAFNVFLTGTDDAAIVLAPSKTDKDRVTGRIFSAEQAILRAEAGLPSDALKADVLSAIDRVDETLTEITRQYEARASALRTIREQIATSSAALRKLEAARLQSQTMVQRFELLGKKYQSDLERLGAADEGAAFFQALPKTPCALCGTPVDTQVNAGDLKANAPAKYRVAVQAEAAKIVALRAGLRTSTDLELQRLATYTNEEQATHLTLNDLERQEQLIIKQVRIEFSSDPKTLALRRSELSSQLNLLEDIERLKAEIESLKSLKGSKPAPVSRDAVDARREVATIAKRLLTAWGLADVTTVELDTEECDLVINNRSRLSYGAGKRALFLTALTIAVLEHGVSEGYPHIGFVVIDSPLKAYADPSASEQATIPLATVRDGFYSWLSTWQGPGQVVILENEPVVESVRNALKPVEFNGPGGNRPGFYPIAEPG